MQTGAGTHVGELPPPGTDQNAHQETQSTAQVFLYPPTSVGLKFLASFPTKS